MTCEDALAVLMEYLDGELTSDRSGLVEAHLRHCESCRQERDAVLSVLGKLHRADELQRYALVVARLRERIAQMEAAMRPSEPQALMTPEEVVTLLRLTSEQFREVAPLLPTVDLAGQRRYLREDVLRWLRQRSRVPAELGPLPGPMTPVSVAQAPRSMGLL